MSKSLGNFILVHDIIKEIDPDVLRFFMISVHYRSPINYNVELVNAAKSGLERIRNSYQLIKEREAIATDLETQTDYIDQINDILKQFEAVMDDDFNTANAVTAWYDLSKLANKYVLENTTSTKVIQRFKEVYQIFSDVLGVPLEGKENDVLLDEDIEKLIEERNEARKNKDFARADEIRDMLKEQNIILEDTPQGVRFRRVNMDAKLLNPLTLAYMGDAVLDQHVREYIVLKLQSKPNRLHQVSKQYVSAKAKHKRSRY